VTAARTATDAAGPQARVRLTQQERSAAAVESMLTAARALRVPAGYAAAWLDDVCERAGVAEGALCHHVCNGRQERPAARITGTHLAVAADPGEAVGDGCREHPEGSLGREVQGITLLDAFAAGS
jgi:hypothetical protein